MKLMDKPTQDDMPFEVTFDEQGYQIVKGDVMLNNRDWAFYKDNNLFKMLKSDKLYKVWYRYTYNGFKQIYYIEELYEETDSQINNELKLLVDNATNRCTREEVVKTVIYAYELGKKSRDCNQSEKMVESDDLFVNDWVMVKDFPMQFQPLQFSNEYRLRSLCKFQAIMLTCEILELNGFQLNDEGDGAWHPSLYNVSGEPIFNFDHTTKDRLCWNGIVVEYVHQLQQIMRIIGLKERANNFKIKWLC